MNKENPSISIILPALNERDNIVRLIDSLNKELNEFKLDILVIDDNSTDGTKEAIALRSNEDSNLRLIERFDRKGLASAIKEGILNSYNDYIVVMDSDGQHKAENVKSALKKIINESLDIVVGSRFMDDSSVRGLSKRRTNGSLLANKIARLSLDKKHSHLSDYMSGFFILKNTSHVNEVAKRIEVKGFKFLYEFLSTGGKTISCGDVPLDFEERQYGESKLNIPIVWDFVISLAYGFTFKIIPRRAISFGLVGCIGVLVQLISFHALENALGSSFEARLIASVFIAAASNFCINNILTFRFESLHGMDFLKGFIQYLLVISLPVALNISVANLVYKELISNTNTAQLAGIIVAYIWNYVATSKFIWKVAGS
ncbi:glycosyltransferase [Synechococcus sp. MU1642]|uniref:glycosyltransferase n=1 Tax=Synechococcus sp. MU1642 TaxID=2508348 RepID=UPI001CF7FF79|nr:glycosyltransferase [Synechococcus sp. MU1642]MCB4407279.1 glycosyltransferase [Synechococcus sp. MU1642]